MVDPNKVGKMIDNANAISDSNFLNSNGYLSAGTNYLKHYNTSISMKPNDDFLNQTGVDNAKYEELLDKLTNASVELSNNRKRIAELESALAIVSNKLKTASNYIRDLETK